MSVIAAVLGFVIEAFPYVCAYIGLCLWACWMIQIELLMTHAVNHQISAYSIRAYLNEQKFLTKWYLKVQEKSIFHQLKFYPPGKISLFHFAFPIFLLFMWILSFTAPLIAQPITTFEVINGTIWSILTAKSLYTSTRVEQRLLAIKASP